MDAEDAPKSETVPGPEAGIKPEPEVPAATDGAVHEGAVTDGAVTGVVTEETVKDGDAKDTAEVEKESDETKLSNPIEKEEKEEMKVDNASEDIKPEPEGNKTNAEDNLPDSKDKRPGNVTPECLAKSDDAKSPETEVPVVPDTDPFSDTNPSPEPAPTTSHPDSQAIQSPEPKEPAASSGPHPVPVPHAHRSGHHSRAGGYTSLTLNQMAIAASAQNKLPTSRLKGILERLGQHTESSAKKRGAWYKSETSYVDINKYSWKNLALYKDYQQNMWTSDGAIKSTCKK